MNVMQRCTKGHVQFAGSLHNSLLRDMEMNSRKGKFYEAGFGLETSFSCISIGNPRSRLAGSGLLPKIVLVRGCCRILLQNAKRPKEVCVWPADLVQTWYVRERGALLSVTH